jgi:hypothetical protein
MWKNTTVRRVLLLPKSKRGWQLLLLLSGVSLLIALIAAVVGFRDGSPSVTGTAKLISLLAALCFLGLGGVGLYTKRR